MNAFGNGEVKISMIDYLKKMIRDFPLKLNENDIVASPAMVDMFKEDNSKKLNDKECELFHTFVAKALFASKRAHPDIQPVVSVLCTRVKRPGKSDWNKLVCLMKFINSTLDDKLTLNADKGFYGIEWYIDAEFALYPDFNSHTGGVMKFNGGKGTPIQICSKQKLNTTSSTIAEVVGVDDGLPLVMWAPLFLEEQFCDVAVNTVYQDNKSSMLLEKNGKRSSGKRTRALNIRYFMITDLVEKGKVKIEHCGTDDMIGDYMSKGLQGVKFNKFRKEIMGL